MKKLFTLLTMLIVAITSSWGAITPKTITNASGEVYMVTPANLYSFYNSGNGWVTNASGGAITSNSYYNSKNGSNNTNYINPETEESGTKAQASGITLKTADNRSARFYFTGAVKATAFIAVTGSGRTANITVYKVSDDTSVGSTTGESYEASGAYEKLEVTGLDASVSYYAKVTATNDDCLYAMKFFAESSTPTLTGAWKIGEDVVSETGIVQGSSATMPTFTVAATSGTPTTSDYQVAYNETGDEGIFTYTDGVPTGISTENAGSATVTATLTTKDATKFLTPTTNTFTYSVTVSQASAPTSATIGTTSAEAEIGAEVTLSITAMDGTPTPTEFKWYSCTDADKTGATEIEGETGNSYTFSKNTTGTYYFFANVKNSQGNVDSNVLSVTVTKKATGLAYATAAVSKNIGAAKFTNALTNPNNLTVAYSVEDGATATGVSVNESTGEVTVGNVAGTATIKASFAGNDEYLAGNATYTLTVVTPDPVVEAANVNIAKTATGGNIAFTVGYHSAHNGELTAATAADWITLGDVTIDANGSGTIPFTNAVNTSHASRIANVTLTYTYDTNKTTDVTMVVAQDPELDGTFTLIKAPVLSNSAAGTITGVIGGTASLSLQSNPVDGGYKFGGNSHYITINLAGENTFKTGDVIIVHTTKAADTKPGTLAIYSGSDLMLNTGTRGIQGINAFALPEDANGKATLTVKRTSTYNFNGYVDYIEVVRAGASVTLNNSGENFNKGFATYCSASNFTVSGATAYAATISGSKLTMSAIEGVIPANTGVVLAGEKNANVIIENTTADATTVSNNDLKGTTAAALTADLKGDATKFLAFRTTTSTFTPYGGTNFPANKAYILLDGDNAPLSLEMVFDEATGINVVNASEAEAKAAPVKVIKNGKLFIGNYNVAGQQVK